MAEGISLFILAGEASGDRLGADLLRRLKERVSVRATGVGGPEMETEGLRSLFPISDLAVMGWSDVIRRLPLLLWRLQHVVRSIARQRPDIVVLIDSQVFSKAVAARVRKAGLNTPMLLYVAPTVWAWRPERAAALQPLFDEVLSILPFEPAEMKRLGGPATHFVGHPAVRRYPRRAAQPEAGPLLLLPGSRTGELRRHLPLMRAAAEQFRNHPRITGFAIPTLEGLVPLLSEAVAEWPVPVELVTGQDRQRAWNAAYAAFAVSGTVTFELAMTGIPMVVAYVADARQWKHYGSLQESVRIALPNIILGRDAVPELHLREGSSFELAALSRLLDEPQLVSGQVAAFDEVRARMQKGAPEAPLEDPADRVLAHVGQTRLPIGS